MTTPIEDFKLTKDGKLIGLPRIITTNSEGETVAILKHIGHDNPRITKFCTMEFIENTVTNIYLPLGYLPPNFLI